MGMDAETSVWVGYDSDKVFERLPNEVRNQIEGDGEIEVGKVAVSEFYVSGKRVGLGVELLCHYRHHEPKEVDLEELARKASELKLKVASIFRIWGIDDEPRVLLTSDLS